MASPYSNYLIFELASAQKRTYNDLNALNAGTRYVMMVNISENSESIRYDACSCSWIECESMDDIKTAWEEGRVTDSTLGTQRGSGWCYYGDYFNYGWDMSLTYWASEHITLHGAYTTRDYPEKPIHWPSDMFVSGKNAFQLGLIAGLAKYAHLLSVIPPEGPPDRWRQVALIDDVMTVDGLIIPKVDGRHSFSTYAYFGRGSAIYITSITSTKPVYYIMTGTMWTGGASVNFIFMSEAPFSVDYGRVNENGGVATRTISGRKCPDEDFYAMQTFNLYICGSQYFTPNCEPANPYSTRLNMNTDSQILDVYHKFMREDQT